ncbi:MAG: DNA cytosine methyltransferase [Gammaproteobacteria bacterium]|nr:DNA cytosine methyltransferase [Gammaproteobacteria bacterium]
MSDKEAYKIIDVFAGPGGLGEGFSAFGYDTGKHPFKLTLSIEKDPSAYSTLLLRSFYRQFESDRIPQEYWYYVRGEIGKEELFNFYPRQAMAAVEEVKCIELGRSSHQKVRELINQRLGRSKKWVLVGGPPCQAYSFVGRSRMKSTDPDFENDKRHLLYREYLRIISDHKPPLFVMENVKGILSSQHSGKRIIEKILSDLRNPNSGLKGRNTILGYRLFSLVDNRPPEYCEPEDFVVEAEKYGIPQARHRVLILGVRKDINITPEILSKSKSVCVWQAISDLPKIRSTVSREPDTLERWRQILGTVTTRSWYLKGRQNGLQSTVDKIDEALTKVQKQKLFSGAEILNYRGDPKVYSTWYRHACEGIIMNHMGRSHIRGDLHRYLFASSFALANKRSVYLGDFPSSLLPAHSNVHESIIKNYFSDRFKVQIKEKPSTTITSHISKDGHYYIHYDPSQCRSLTVREAARLQTFPDNYKFEGKRTAQYHQVGNAVPPLLSMQIAEIVHDILKRIKI